MKISTIQGGFVMMGIGWDFKINNRLELVGTTDRWSQLIVSHFFFQVLKSYFIHIAF